MRCFVAFPVLLWVHFWLILGVEPGCSDDGRAGCGWGAGGARERQLGALAQLSA